MRPAIIVTRDSKSRERRRTKNRFTVVESFHVHNVMELFEYIGIDIPEAVGHKVGQLRSKPLNVCMSVPVPEHQYVTHGTPKVMYRSPEMVRREIFT